MVGCSERSPEGTAMDTPIHPTLLDFQEGAEGRVKNAIKMSWKPLIVLS